MLVLGRKIGEEIVMPSCHLSVKVLDVRGASVKLGIAAPEQYQIHRKENMGSHSIGRRPDVEGRFRANPRTFG